MAQMYPPALDPRTPSGAERLMYRELKSQLPGEYAVLHSVAWITAQRGRHADGETDFLIVHPRRGVLVLEVKGGAIQRDGATGQWASVDQGGTMHAIKDPFDQAQRAMYALREKLAHSPTTGKFRFPMSRAVALPDIVVGHADLGINMPRDLIIDSSDLSRLPTALDRAWGAVKDEGPGGAGVKALIDLLRPTLALTRRGLLSAIRDEQDVMLQLTEQQLALLDFLAGQRRVAISGTAGSGKTILALEQTRRLALQGNRVLFTCFNKALAATLRTALRAELGELASQVVVTTYHDLAADFASRAGLAVPSEAQAMQRPDASSYFEVELPDKLLTAIGALPDRFDAIVVDEGQDFADIWWVTLESLLKEGEDGALYVFYDNNQRIYRNRGSYPIPPPHFQLTRNCRSTRAIHTAAASFTDHPELVDCHGPEGRPVEVIGASGAAEVAALRRVIHRVTVEEGIPLTDIVVLSPRSARTSQFKDGMKIGNLTLSWDPEAGGTLQCRTIHWFKGLESPIVILAEIDRAYAESRDALMHVAMTRARNHLIVLGAMPQPATRVP